MKILIIGTVGSGKTTLAKKISKQYNIKHHEIDSIVHDDSKNGEKRTEKNQYEIIKTIDMHENWIIEGVLRKNLFYLLELADKIIYMNIPKKLRNRRIFIRFIKQILKLEKSNYKPTLKMLKQMYKWSNDFEEEKEYFEVSLKKFGDKLILVEDTNKFRLEK